MVLGFQNDNTGANEDFVTHPAGFLEHRLSTMSNDILATLNRCLKDYLSDGPRLKVHRTELKVVS